MEIKDGDSYAAGWNAALDEAIRLCQAQRDEDADDSPDSRIWNGCIAKCVHAIGGEKISGTFDSVEEMFKALRKESR